MQRNLRLIVVLASVIFVAIFLARYMSMRYFDESHGVLSNLPTHLHFLIPVALQFGGYQFPEDIRSFAATISDRDRAQLSVAAEKMRSMPLDDELNIFFDQYPITEYPESAKLFYLMDVFDEVIGDPPSNVVKSDGEKIAEYIADLQSHGSYRLASRRMWAAMFLAKMGSAAVSAVPYLERACDDEDARVQIWANAALACIAGKKEMRLDRLRELRVLYNCQSDDVSKALLIDVDDAIKQVTCYGQD